ncbi:ABC transporter permease [Telmatospirillum siberiense]|uniref:ABC transporter permease n=1 Tax=Telmatospirillum siberiense TaxID=382514 RepID=A0A2N3PVL6_9PROT|nr:ABC transporter permease [Telmatospirillum siberiense]PKU24439.1 ABC transporter permease [Telmatospirillum siberiense]
MHARRSPMTPLVLLTLPAFALPVGGLAESPLAWWQSTPALLALAIVLASLVLARWTPRTAFTEALLLAPGLFAGAALPLVLLDGGVALDQAAGLWMFLAGILALLWHVMERLTECSGFFRHLLVPALFGVMLIYLWEVGVRGFQVPSVLLPPPSSIAGALTTQTANLEDDFFQTVIKAVLRGYLWGCGAGFAVAILADRVPFLARGLLPFGNLVSAIPVVGIAPIMVMWFGFDWPSKAAVVVVMTFFPMLVNTLAGLAASEAIQLDLMRSYAAGYWRTLLMLRLPNAMPFLFNGLKINSTLALIGAIVAEFFGTPVVGMGFRISTEVARMNLSIVWATIVVAGITGSLMYGGLSWLERTVTAWHPSYRRR